MCLFTSARTLAIVFARSAGSEAMYWAGVLTFDGGFITTGYNHPVQLVGKLDIERGGHRRANFLFARQPGAIRKQPSSRLVTPGNRGGSTPQYAVPSTILLIW